MDKKILKIVITLLLMVSVSIICIVGYKYSQRHTDTQSKDVIENFIENVDQQYAKVNKKVAAGYLNKEKIGKKFVYSALINEENTINNEVDELFEKFCQRKHLAILEHLIETVPMTCDDITKLQDLLNDKQRKTVVEVVCNCTPGQCDCKENLEVTP